MDKQEALEELVKTGKQFLQTASNVEIDSNSRSVATGVASGLNMAKNVIAQLDEPQKIKVPEFVAKWFETNKYVLDRAILDYMFEDYASDDSEFGKWFDNKNGKPIETLVRMLDGYEVEEEPKYYLDLPKMGMVNEISNSQLCWTNCEGGITEKEIKAIDERYWPFAVPVEKV